MKNIQKSKQESDSEQNSLVLSVQDDGIITLSTGMRIRSIAPMIERMKQHNREALKKRKIKR